MGCAYMAKAGQAQSLGLAPGVGVGVGNGKGISSVIGPTSSRHKGSSKQKPRSCNFMGVASGVQQGASPRRRAKMEGVDPPPPPFDSPPASPCLRTALGLSRPVSCGRRSEGKECERRLAPGKGVGGKGAAWMKVFWTMPERFLGVKARLGNKTVFAGATSRDPASEGLLSMSWRSSGSSGQKAGRHGSSRLLSGVWWFALPA